MPFSISCGTRPCLRLGLISLLSRRTPGRRLVRLFDFADNPQLVEAGWDLQDRRIARKVRHDNDTLNLTLLFDGQSVTAEFNYHTDTANNQTAREAIQGRVLGLRDTAIRLLQQVYDLEVGGGDDNG